MISDKVKNSTTIRSLLIMFVFITIITGIAVKGYAVSQDMKSYGKIMSAAGYQRTKTYVMLLEAYNIRQDYLSGDYDKYQDGVDSFYATDSIHDSYLQNFYEIRDGNDVLNMPKEEDAEIIQKINDIAVEMELYMQMLEDVVYKPDEAYNFAKIYMKAEVVVFEINSLVGLYENRYQDSIDYENNLFIYSFGVTLLFAVILFWINTHIFKYETLAKFDVLTGLRNIGYLNQEVSSLEGKPYAVVFIDLNKFKSINDTYGHSVGDDILRAVGKRLNKVFKGDFTFRYGGDEIVVFIPEKNCSQIDQYIKNLEDVVFQPVRDSNGMIHNVTGSVGIIGDKVTKSSISKALNMADSLMYKAKQNGAEKPYYINDDKKLAVILGDDIS